MPPPVIRPAAFPDLPAVTAIHNHSILHTTATFDTEPKTEAEQMAWFKAHGEWHPMLVASWRHEGLARTVFATWAVGAIGDDMGRKRPFAERPCVKCACRGPLVGRCGLAEAGLSSMEVNLVATEILYAARESARTGQRMVLPAEIRATERDKLLFGSCQNHRGHLNLSLRLDMVDQWKGQGRQG